MTSTADKLSPEIVTIPQLTLKVHGTENNLSSHTPKIDPKHTAIHFCFLSTNLRDPDTPPA